MKNTENKRPKIPTAALKGLAQYYSSALLEREPLRQEEDIINVKADATQEIIVSCLHDGCRTQIKLAYMLERDAWRIETRSDDDHMFEDEEFKLHSYIPSE